MKGFPNQVSDLEKIAAGIQTLVQLMDRGDNVRDDGIFGAALVRAGVAGTGHTPRPIENYIREQLAKKPSNQSFRTTARGLRELFRLLDLIDDSGEGVEVTDIGQQASTFAGEHLTPEQIGFWRKVIRNMAHDGGDNETSHPYQVLLRLIARTPGITRAKCALALEARNDSSQELDRIVTLANLPEHLIIRRINVTRANWDNAKKVLPKFAEQLGDVIRTGQSYVLATAPGHAGDGPIDVPKKSLLKDNRRAPRGSRQVTPGTIGQAGIAERFDEVDIQPNIDPVAAQQAIRQRLDRLRRHNLIVRALASRLNESGGQLFEDPFDVLALINKHGILGEVKTLDGTPKDERDRVRDALSQLLYYEAFVIQPITGKATVYKVACFESPISTEHQGWLAKAEIATIWLIGNNSFAGNQLAGRILGDFIKELR